MLLPTALVLRDLCFLLYGGPLVAFTAVVLAARLGAVPYLSLQQAVRAYRAWGPGLGVSLGLTILFLLSAHWLQQGAFTWPGDTPHPQLTLAAWLTFFVLWVSNLWLEVWTLEPLRKLDAPDKPFDATAFARASGPLLTHMGIHSGLILAVVILFGVLAHLP